MLVDSVDCGIKLPRRRVQKYSLFALANLKHPLSLRFGWKHVRCDCGMVHASFVVAGRSSLIPIESMSSTVVTRVRLSYCLIGFLRNMMLCCAVRPRELPVGKLSPGRSFSLVSIASARYHFVCARTACVGYIGVVLGYVLMKSLLRAHAPCKCVRLRRAARRVGVTAHERFLFSKASVVCCYAYPTAARRLDACSV